MVKLGVNVDHVATLRQARGTKYPDPVAAAALAELAGVDGITIHLREDRRHIQDRDLLLLRQTVQTRLNLEMAASSEMIDIALKVRPDMVTLVPEKREELTTEGGLDVIAHREELTRAFEQFKEGGLVISFFIDPDGEQIRAAHAIGAPYVEIHTGLYCEAGNRDKEDREFRRIAEGVKVAQDLGMKVNLGHGIDYFNVKRLATLEGIEEFSIGHSIISRAVFVGLQEAIREMRELISPGARC